MTCVLPTDNPVCVPPPPEVEISNLILEKVTFDQSYEINEEIAEFGLNELMFELDLDQPENQDSLFQADKLEFSGNIVIFDLILNGEYNGEKIYISKLNQNSDVLRSKANE